jgi:hypothetical protein
MAPCIQDFLSIGPNQIQRALEQEVLAVDFLQLLLADLIHVNAELVETAKPLLFG